MNTRAAAAAIACAAAASLAAQDLRFPAIPPRFTATIEYVEVNARVLDRNGEPIRDLDGKDFTVLEDGVKQAVSVFSLIDLQRPEAGQPGIPPAEVRPDVATNATGSDRGRTYLIVLDALSIERNRTLAVRKFLRDFIERSIGPDDRVGISTTGGDRAYENFTNDKGRLLAAVARLFGQSDGLPAVADGTTIDARISQRQLVQWVQAMSGAGEGSKAIILVTEGLPIEIVSNTEGLSLVGDIDRVAAAARQGNVPIYPVDPRGLTSGGDEAIQVGVAAAGSTPASQVLEEVRRAHDRLRALADDSGGAAIVGVNDLPGGLDRVVSLSSTYYVLGYYSTNPKRDGKYHRIEVKVDRPGARVLARRGYTAPPAKAPKAAPLPGPRGSSPELREALNAALPVGGVPLTATAAVFRAPDARRASVFVVIEAQGANPDAPVEMAVAALAPGGAIRDGEFGRVNFSRSPETADSVRRSGFRWLARLDDLKPGRYQIRGAVSNGPARQGSVWYDIDIPEFAKAPLAMSGVLLSPVAASERLTLQQDALPAGALPAPATTRREFASDGAIAIYAEAYDNDRVHRHEVETSVVVVNDRGEEQSRAVETHTASNGLVRILARLPLGTLAPGRYTIAVEARQTANRAISAGRAVPFQVVAGGNR